MRTLVSNSAFRIAIIYVAAAAAWILVSDALVYFHIAPTDRWFVESLKGLAFIGASGALIFFLVRSPLEKLEDALREQIAVRNQLRRAQSVAEIGSWEVDFDTGALSWSDETFRIFEMKKDDFAATEEAFFELIHPHDKRAFLEAREQWLRNGGAFSFEHRIRTPTGKTKIVVEHAEAFFNSDGSPSFTTGTVQDVTEQRRREAEALAWYRRLEVAIEAAQIGIWEYTPSNDKLVWSSRMFDLFGVPQSRFKGRFSDWRDTVHPDDLQEVERPVLDVLEGKSPRFSVQFRIIRPSDGKVRHLLGHGKLARATAIDGQDVLTGANVDITEWVSTQEQLTHAQKLESVGQLTGGIAHDFNNHLTVVISCLDAITEISANDDEITNYAIEGQKAGQNAAELTARLLAFSRKQALKPQATDLNSLLDDIEPLVKRTLPETISLTFDRLAGLWLCEVDRGQAESAILNLAINARDAMPEGGTLVIETANTILDEDYCRDQENLQPGAYFMVAVSDTGSGMSPEVQDKAFEPFFTTKEVGKGIGMGLSMIYGFAKQSKGHVKIYSEPGEGTTVKLYFPQSRSALAAKTQERPEETSITGGEESVLLVEDNPMVRKQLVLQLKRMGYGVTAAPDGDAALSIVEDAESFDLLLTDVVLPGGYTGPQLAEEVLKRRPNMKVLFTSGYTEDAITHSGRLDVGVHLLPKPFRRVDLARKLREALEA